MNIKSVWIIPAAAILMGGCGLNDAVEEPAVKVMARQTGLLSTTTVTEITTTEAVTDAAVYAAPSEIAALPAASQISPEQIDPANLSEYFTAEAVPDAVFARINGVSYHENPNISLDDLRYLRVLHYDPAGEIRTGELLCNQAIADDLLDIFRGLYDANYAIERMVLVDAYGGDDDASMAANNTSCFNYRVIAGSTTPSYHAQGRAIDINPRYNPYVTFAADGSAQISPENGVPYADREMFFPMKIDRNDLCYQLFTAHGFEWGGDWDTPLDYQHFEKPVS